MGFNWLGFFGKPYLWFQSSSGFSSKPCAAQIHCSAVWGLTALLPRGNETTCLVSPLCPQENRQGQLTQRTTSAKKAFKDPYYCFNKSGSASFLQGQGPGLSCPLPPGLTSLQSACTLATQQTLLPANKSSPRSNYPFPGCWSHLTRSLFTAPARKMQQLLKNQTGHNKTRTSVFYCPLHNASCASWESSGRAAGALLI